MSASENKKPAARDYVEDPELPLDQAEGLSAAEHETARRQRYLDHQLRAAMADLREQVDRRQPDADSFMLRLQNSIEAYDRETGAGAKKGDRDAAGYLGKIAWRRRATYLRERFISGENAGWRMATAALLLAFAAAPILYYEPFGGSHPQIGAGTDALAEDEGALDSGDAVAFADLPTANDAADQRRPQDADRQADQAGIHATANGPDGAATEESSDVQDARVAVAAPGGEKAAAAAPPGAVEQSADERSEVALRSRQFEMTERDGASATPADPAASVELQVAILTERLKKAGTPEEKLLILRGLRTLYEKSGQTAKMRETDRKIELLKE